jgi:hypothetical protein
MKQFFPPTFRLTAAAVFSLVAIVPLFAQTEAPRKTTWSQFPFAIVKFNEDAPKSWNLYKSERKGFLLLRLWKRYLLLNVSDEEVYDLDPKTLIVNGTTVDWSFSDLPKKTLDTPDWKERNIGGLQRVRFRLGKDGHFLELQLPFDVNGRPMY